MARADALRSDAGFCWGGTWLRCAATLTILASLATAQDYQWTKLSPQTSPPATVHYGMAYDAGRNEILMFGGDAPAQQNFWIWKNGNWSQRFPAHLPPARSGHKMVYDSARAQVVLFGGLGSSGNLNDTWVWDGVDWTQRFPASAPSPRNQFAMAYDAARDEIVLLGGGGGEQFRQTWVWNGADWVQRFPHDSPSGRGGHTMTYDSKRGRVVLFGGLSDTGPMNDTWEWDGSNWLQRSPAVSPTPRVHHASAFDPIRGHTVVFSGLRSGEGTVNDLWVWDGNNWNPNPTTQTPTPRTYFFMVYETAADRAFTFSGLEAPNDTWVLTGPQIVNVSVTFTSSPGGRTLVIDGTDHITPKSFDWPVGSTHTISAPSPQTIAGTRYAFANWSDGGAATHTITATQAGTLTATFTASHLLTLAANPPSGGTVAASPPSSEGGFFAAGSTVQLTATPNSGFVFTGYTGDVTGASNPANVTMNGPKSITANFQQCTFGFVPASIDVEGSGGVARVTVTPSNPACSWAVAGLPSWVTANYGGTGTGLATVVLTIDANPAQSQRSATFTIAGQPYGVTQAGATPNCSYAVSPSSASVPQAGGIGSVSVTTSEGCTWRASTAAPWVTFTLSGSGSATVPYTVLPNTGSAARTATLLLGGRSVTLTQPGLGPPDCTLTFGPVLTFAAFGGTQTVTVTVGTGCAWQASSNAPWLGISTGASGTGNGAFTVIAAGNTGAEPRTGTVTVNGQTLTVTQAGVAVGLRFVPVPPCRIMDTRNGSGLTGAFGPPVLSAGATREIPIPASACGIPSGAQAYSLNVTVIPDAGMLQFLTLWPAGQPRPNASTLNSFDGKIVANAALVPAGANGAVSVFVTDRAHVILDINGYFAQ